MEYKDLALVIKKLKTEYAIIIDNKPFIIYRLSLKGCIYIEKLIKNQQYYRKKIYKVYPDNSVKLECDSFCDEYAKNVWVKNHQELLKQQ